MRFGLESAKSNNRVRVHKALCVFKGRDERLFDIRKDVSFVRFDDAKIDKDGVKFTLDVSMRKPDAFYLDCVVAVSATKIGSPSCSLREIPENPPPGGAASGAAH